MQLKPTFSGTTTLWSETVLALKDIPKKGELFFYTKNGNQWVRAIQSVDKFGKEKFTKEDAVSKQFSKLLKKTA